MSKPSVKMTVRKGVTVVRDGARVRPTIGEDFSFTAEERDGIISADPAALTKPAKQSEGESSDPASTTPPARTAETSQAKARGGRKAATANTADSDDAAGDDETTDPKSDGNPAPQGAGTDDDL